MSKELKEQIMEILCNSFNDTINEPCAYCEATDKIFSILADNNFVQLQAGADGLVKKESRCVKCRAENNGECFDIECTTHSYERGFKDGTVAQKALCDKEKEEVVKKVFDWIDKNVGDSYEMRLPAGTYEAFKKQTLEELK